MGPWVVLLVGCREAETPLPTGDTGPTVPEPEPEEDADRSILENEVRRLVNEVRVEGASCGEIRFPGGLPPLESDGLLRIVARAHSQDMAERGFFDHTNPDGADPVARIAAAGFDGDLPWGENIACGTDDAARVVEGWIASPGHCENILDPEFQVIGVGYFSDVADAHWTQVFAGSHGTAITAR